MEKWTLSFSNLTSSHHLYNLLGNLFNKWKEKEHFFVSFEKVPQLAVPHKEEEITG